MKVHIELTIYDAVELLRAAVAERYGVEVGGVTVKSWNEVVFEVQDETLIYPVRHHLRADHSVLEKR